jgi:hypothetical protein
VSSWKVVGAFVQGVRKSRLGKKLVAASEHAMSLHDPLPAELEAQAQELAARIRRRADDELLALARLLVSKPDHELFGETEFQIRTLVHRIGARAIEERSKKRTATSARASSAPPAAKRRPSRGTAAKRS